MTDKEAAWDKFARTEGYAFTDAESNHAFNSGWDAALPAGGVQHVWFPLGDTPVVLSISREQLQIIQDTLRGELATSRKEWRDSLAEQIENALKATVDGA